jgi:hypothetical protein
LSLDSTILHYTATNKKKRSSSFATASLWLLHNTSFKYSPSLGIIVDKRRCVVVDYINKSLCLEPVCVPMRRTLRQTCAALHCTHADTATPRDIKRKNARLASMAVSVWIAWTYAFPFRLTRVGPGDAERAKQQQSGAAGGQAWGDSQDCAVLCATCRCRGAFFASPAVTTQHHQPVWPLSSSRRRSVHSSKSRVGTLESRLSFPCLDDEDLRPQSLWREKKSKQTVAKAHTSGPFCAGEDCADRNGANGDGHRIVHTGPKTTHTAASATCFYF